MPFEKGRKKTGGRVKGGPVKRSNRLIDQLKNYGFNFPKALALALKDLPKASLDPITYKTWSANYSELAALLPYMAPKLREREIIFKEEDDKKDEPERKISDEELLRALDHGSAKQTNSKPISLHLQPPSSFSSAKAVDDSKSS